MSVIVLAACGILAANVLFFGALAAIHLRERRKEEKEAKKAWLRK